MKRFFLEREKILSDKPTLTGPDVKHIRTVLRLKPGDEIFLFDGQGSEYPVRIIQSTSKAIILSVAKAFPSTSESPARITIAQGLLRAGKMDGVVRQVTELGVHALIPLIAERSVPKPKSERWAEKERRWKTIACESLKQCGRSQVPRLEPPIPFEALVRRSQAYHHKIIFHDGDPISPGTTKAGGVRDGPEVLALVGPEGGFAPNEVEMAVVSGFQRASLGPRILKADTAVVAACTILQYVFGDIGNAPKKP